MLGDIYGNRLFSQNLLSYSDIASSTHSSLTSSPIKQFLHQLWKVVTVKGSKTVEEPEFPDQPVQNINVEIHNVDRFYPLRYISSITEPMRKRYEEPTDITSSDLLFNPFSHGLSSIVFSYKKSTYLKLGASDNYNDMFEDAQIYKYGLCMKRARSNILLAMNYSSKIYLKLSDYFKHGKAPLSVLVHHVMLYEYYPEEFQDVLWSATQFHVMHQVRLNRASLLQARACYQKLGDIRMYFIDPADMYVPPDSLNWLIICTKDFQGLIQLKRTMDAKKLFQRRSKHLTLAQFATSSSDLSWLCMMLSIGRNARALPIHGYLSAKKVLYPSIIPDNVFCMRQVDSVLFKEIHSIHQFLEFQGRLFMDLQDCQTFHREYEIYHCYRTGKPLYESYEEKARGDDPFVMRSYPKMNFEVSINSNKDIIEKYKQVFEYKRNSLLRPVLVGNGQKAS
ncbi:hypothetical protein SPOG_02658 [Schizosaccharomyces cryophilus OY26]|uniref:Uncharacterized protein n=1 Tax=Schizosaccharomyces cryophilus (strain OY26 / ATCC MYA-4695 / CBS 11777 / NBRC 106824 / NRRL Y48691) TaxID=653667 RepID=S9X311_SCHCR|nr:uncharacterized protein SPOG_02658 [Schizosaccharomyces cryophilus OY26]EPY51487.1 hypothetical protein SPOG_02658 [Schizosaccharomyces cryophilus OY26]